ncbi:tetratricopeptide repeat protein [Sphingomonas sp. LB-2]|uniref:tetratricopeptide repeat protein n=1 Tax=Sphingomonas caeni TaxID=2984949 RepID=UPI0022310283|nr:tetratricopeptide repeat protein [Sphingomonas caeni]MCW3849454.1 tetratricopeptide repeat protein [Sphingomonas caeni]
MDADAKARKWALVALIAALLILGGTILWSSLRGAAPAPANEMAGELTIDALEDAANVHPDDGAAWSRLGMARFDREEFALAVPALQRAAALLPGKADLWALLGEAMFKATGESSMSPEARVALRKALAIDPGNPSARYYLAVARELDGDHEGAITDWLALLADTPPGSVYEAGLRQTIEQVGKIHHIETASRLAAVKQPTPPGAGAPPTAVANLPGPTAEQVQDGARLSPSQQMEMGRGMVERLEAKLEADPSNLAGWIMLMRSRMQLNEPDRAKAALRDAIAANPGAKAQLESEAAALGVPK